MTTYTIWFRVGGTAQQCTVTARGDSSPIETGCVVWDALARDPGIEMLSSRPRYRTVEQAQYELALEAAIGSLDRVLDAYDPDRVRAAQRETLGDGVAGALDELLSLYERRVEAIEDAARRDPEVSGSREAAQAPEEARRAAAELLLRYPPPLGTVADDEEGF